MYSRPDPVKPPLKHRFLRRLTILLTFAFVLYLGWAWLAVPTSAFSGNTAQLQTSTIPQGTPTIAWPDYGQAAVGTEAFGVLAVHGNNTSVPIASVAKVILALSVMQKKPFVNGSQGGNLTLTQADVDSYNTWYSKGGSVALVRTGEQISEYQALQALLLPSANNMADTLAVWAFGSIDAYKAYANQYVTGLGLTQTHLNDASGYDPGTVSSARDLVKIGQLALKNAVLKDIVSQKSAVVPVAGTVKNVNSLIGSNGFVGIKTGNTDQAGGCLLFAAEHTVNGQKVTIVGAVLGAKDRFKAINESNVLVNTAKDDLASTTVAVRGKTIATYTLPWGESATALVDDNLRAITWAGGDVTSYVSLDSVHLPVSKGQAVGTYVATSRATQTRNSVPLVLQDEIKGPTFLWRVTHPTQTWNLRFN